MKKQSPKEDAMDTPRVTIYVKQQEASIEYAPGQHETANKEREWLLGLGWTFKCWVGDVDMEITFWFHTDSSQLAHDTQAKLQRRKEPPQVRIDSGKQQASVMFHEDNAKIAWIEICQLETDGWTQLNRHERDGLTTINFYTDSAAVACMWVARAKS